MKFVTTSVHDTGGKRKSDCGQMRGESDEEEKEDGTTDEHR
jgi:hypothetical protein